MIGLQINGESYYYVRNMQGDVNSIIDENGEVVVNYVYDTWGKVISVSGTLADTVGEQNPIRYRGYYYDTETGLYYLNSRYYDPETGRFISADVQAENGNLYAYCQNDPVNLTDESGYLSKLWKRIIKIAIGVVATVAAVAITVATGGAALPVVGGVIASTLISGGIAAGVTALQGGSKEDILEAGIDGLCDGLMWGGIFALGGSIINACQSSSSLFSISDQNTGRGYSSFAEFKKAEGNAGVGRDWHHLVEQCQIKKSGFAPEQIHNTNNMVIVEKSVHRKISAYYSSIKDFSNNQTVRNWLAGQPFEEQLKFGKYVLNLFIG